MLTARQRVKRVHLVVIALLCVLILSFQDVKDGATNSSGADAYTGFLPVIHIPPLPPTDWLNYVNYYRTMAELPEVIENPDWSYGNVLHGRYSVHNNVLIHDEDPANPWYTPEGQAAARASNLAGSYDISATYLYAIDSWMQAPFHAVGMLDPQLQRVGYGDYQEATGGLQMAAGIDVIRGLGSVSSEAHFPVIWPAAGTVVPLTLHWGEYPSPLTGCPGYGTPSGLPLILQISSGNLTPEVTAHSFMQEGNYLEHCIFDETNYVNADPAQESLGRGILNNRDAIVLIPRHPLAPGATYHVSITANGETYAWSFSVSDSPNDQNFIPPHNHLAPTFPEEDSQ